MTLRGEVALHDAQPDDQQHDRADRHVQAMEAGQHEEGRAVHARAQLQAELGPGVVVLVGLHAEEREAQDEGQRQEQLEQAALAVLQRMVGDGQGHAGGEQQRGVQRRQAPGMHHLELAALQRTEPRGSAASEGPAALEAGVQQGGHRLRSLAAEPGQRQLPGVEQRAEERGEEHDLGKDEPHHPHAEGTVHLHVVDARLVLRDHGAEPAIEQGEQPQQPGDEHPAPAADVGQVQGGAGHQDQQHYRAEEGQGAAVRDVVLVRVVRVSSVCHQCVPHSGGVAAAV